MSNPPIVTPVFPHLPPMAPVLPRLPVPVAPVLPGLPAPAPVPLTSGSPTIDTDESSRVLGSTEPRLFTPPLRELTSKTSYGFEVIDFARDVLNEPLDPWEAWLVIHAGELLPDGRPRFRRVLVMVARQNGKTHVLKVLSLFWLFKQHVPLIVGTSTNLDYARESWAKAVDHALSNDHLLKLLPTDHTHGVRRANGEQTLTTADRCRYKIATANRTGGRSLTIHRLMADEVREHHDWNAYNASYPAMNAVLAAQAWFTSNAGDDKSVVLNSLRDTAMTGVDNRLGMFEWSAPDGCDIEDPKMWALANPNLGRRLDYDTIAAAAAAAKANGGEELAGFKTECLCMRVNALDAAVEAKAWKDSTIESGNLAAFRGKVAACLDVAPDGMHATITAAAVVAPGVTRVLVVGAWNGNGCTEKLRAELPALMTKVRPRSFGWFPSGPAAALAADLTQPKTGRIPGFPPSTTISEIRGDASAACMGFADRVKTGGVEHLDDPLLNTHVLGAEKLYSGDTWRFSRKAGHCDAAFSAAGAVHLALTLPPAPSFTRPSSIS